MAYKAQPHDLASGCRWVNCHLLSRPIVLHDDSHNLHGLNCTERRSPGGTVIRGGGKYGYPYADQSRAVNGLDSTPQRARVSLLGKWKFCGRCQLTRGLGVVWAAKGRAREKRAHGPAILT